MNNLNISIINKTFILFTVAYKWFNSKPSGNHYIFISGSARSGTTLLKTILMSHSKIVGIDGESTGAFKIRNFSKYSTGEIPNNKMNSYFKQSKSFIEFYNKIAKKIMDGKNGTFFVDKIWPNWIRFKLVTHYFPEARWIVCCRDGRDCFCSSRRHPNVPQNRDTETFARYWKKSIRLCSSLPGKCTTWVKYEDFVMNPEYEMRRIMNHLNLQFEPEQLDVKHYSKQTSIKKLDQHQNLKRQISPFSVARWKHELSKEQNQRFCRIAGNTLNKMGYEE